MMEHLPGGFTLEIPSGAFPLSTDSMALSGFVRLPRQARVLDLGSGCGTLGLLLCADHPDCHVTGIELDPAAHQGALENIRRNNLSSRLESICADLRTIPGLVPPGSFAVCISNPPYFSGGIPAQTLPLARREDACGLDDLFRAGAWALKFGGDFFLVHRPERLAEVMARGVAHRLEPKRLRLLRHREGGPVALVLLQCRKGAKPGLVWEEMTLHHTDGSPTADYRHLYHLIGG